MLDDDFILNVSFDSFGPEPIAQLRIIVRDSMLVSALFVREKTNASSPVSPVGQDILAWFQAYLKGKNPSVRALPFDLRSVAGTAFQKACWEGLLAIPYGEVWSYKQLAQHIGAPKAVRAVGQANRINPLALIVPCHRVICSDGTLGGYMGREGGRVKERLLRHEGVLIV